MALRLISVPMLMSSIRQLRERRWYANTHIDGGVYMSVGEHAVS